MNVGELKKMLDQYPDNVEVLVEKYSDYRIIADVDCSVMKAVQKEGWVMRSHPTMSQENKAKEKEYLALEAGD